MLFHFSFLVLQILIFCYYKLTHYYMLEMFHMLALLLVLQFLQSFDGRLYCDSRNSVVGPGTTSCHFHEGITMVDAHSLSLHHRFTTKGASVCGILADINFLQDFPEGGTIMGPIFIHKSDLLVVLIMSSHKY